MKGKLFTGSADGSSRCSSLELRKKKLGPDNKKSLQDREIGSQESLQVKH